MKYPVLVLGEGRPQLWRGTRRDRSVPSLPASASWYPPLDPDSGSDGDRGEGRRAHSGDVQAYGGLGKPTVLPWGHRCFLGEGAGLTEERWQLGTQSRRSGKALASSSVGSLPPHRSSSPD